MHCLRPQLLSSIKIGLRRVVDLIGISFQVQKELWLHFGGAKDAPTHFKHLPIFPTFFQPMVQKIQFTPLAVYH